MTFREKDLVAALRRIVKLLNDIDDPTWAERYVYLEAKDALAYLADDKTEVKLNQIRSAASPLMEEIAEMVESSPLSCWGKFHSVLAELFE